MPDYKYDKKAHRNKDERTDAICAFGDYIYILGAVERNIQRFNVKDQSLGWQIVFNLDDIDEDSIDEFVRVRTKKGERHNPMSMTQINDSEIAL